MPWTPTIPTAPPPLAVPGWYAVLILAGGGGLSATAVISGSGVVTAAITATSTARTATATITGAGFVARTGAGAALSVTATITGAGTVTAAATLPDPFTRANSTTSAGPGWTNRLGVVGVSGNNAYGVTGSSWNIASWNTAMTADDAEVSMTLGTFAGTGGWDYALIMLGCDTAGRGVFSFLNAAGGQVVICDNTDWTVATYTAVGTSGSVSWTTGTVFKLKRVGNVYTAYLNGVSAVGWTDSGNSVPRDSSHRLVAMGTYNDGAGSRFIDMFDAAVVTAAITATSTACTATATITGAGLVNRIGTGTALSVTATTTGTGAVTVPAITVIGTPAAVESNTITLPTHAVGDIIIITVGGFSGSAITTPTASGTVPAWTVIDTIAFAGTSPAMRTVYFKATATNHTSGTWSNAATVTAIVLRNQRTASSPIGGHAIAQGGGAVSTFVTAPAVTLTNSSGSSFLLHMYVCQGNSVAWAAAPTGYTRQAAVASATTGAHICMNSKTVTTSDGANNQDTGLADYWVGATIEILAP